MNKAAAIEALRRSLLERLTSLRGVRDAARAGTRVDGDHRPANRGERAAVSSQGYLSAGLDQRLAGVEASLAALEQVEPGPRDRVVAGALVEVEVEGEAGAQRFFVLPGGTGEVVEGVVVLSPGSPRVRPLLGAREGDVAELPDGDELEVISVR